MLLAGKTVKSDWCVSICLLLVKKSIGLLLVKCLLCVCFVVVIAKITNYLASKEEKSPYISCNHKNYTQSKNTKKKLWIRQVCLFIFDYPPQDQNL